MKAVRRNTRRGAVMLEFLISLIVLLPVSVLAFDMATSSIASLEVERALTTAVEEAVLFNGHIREANIEDYQSTFDAVFEDSFANHIVKNVTLTRNSDTRLNGNECVYASDSLVLRADFETKFWAAALLGTIRGSFSKSVTASAPCLLRGETR